jgi:hypothetical protein
VIATLHKEAAALYSSPADTKSSSIHHNIPQIGGNSEGLRQSIPPMPAQRVVDCIGLAERLHAILCQSLDKARENLINMEEREASMLKEAFVSMPKSTPVAGSLPDIQPRRLVAEFCPTLLYCLTLIGGLCGSVNNIWNVLLLLRRLNISLLLRRLWTSKLARLAGGVKMRQR